MLHYTVLLLPDEEGGFTVTVPMLPGCVTQGETLSEALEMAQDAISLVVTDMQANQEPVPQEPMLAAVLEQALAEARSLAREAAGLSPDAPLGALEPRIASVIAHLGEPAAA
jgi:antitoxin HicB